MPDVFSVVERSLTRHLALLRREDRAPGKLIVAYSGGKDSRVLLHVLARLADIKDFPAVEAVHVHHGLSPHADEWAEFCRQSSAALNVPCHLYHLKIEKLPRTSLEDIARKQRYRQLFAFCREHDAALVLGQHQDDQLETFLLQLKRGAGPKGLAGMGECQEREGVMLLRPMLNISQQDITAYANDNNLKWVEDESNTDTRFDRNFLRRDIIPLLQSRWPGFAKAAGRSATLCAEQELLLAEVARERLEHIVEEDSVYVPRLLRYSEQWQRRLLREWLTVRQCPLPTYAQMGELINFLHARHDSQPELRLQQYVIRRWNERLWLTNPVPSIPTRLPIIVAEAVTLDWFDTVLQVDSPGEVEETPLLELRTGSLSKRVKPRGYAYSKPMKAWLKEWGVPPWLRPLTAVIYLHEEAVGVCLPENFVAFTTLPESLQVSYRPVRVHRN